MELGLFQQQTVKLVMTQELRQAISILQYSRQELTQFIQEQALENPLIELEEPAFDQGGSDLAAYKTSTYRGNDDYNPFDFIKDDRYSLKEDLAQQARCLNLDEPVYKRLLYFILLLDDDGYLPANITTEAAEELRRPEAEIEEILLLLQKLDPPGIGARSLKECLALQIKQTAPDDDLALIIVENHLTLLADRSWQELASLLSVSMEEAKEAGSLIQRLNPKPGALYNTEKPSFMQPDLTVEKAEDHYKIVLHDDFLPVVRLNPFYRSYLSGTEKNEAGQYIREKYKQMMWLVKSIEQRRITLTRVMETIVRKQRGFLEKGMRDLVPMTLKEVADELDVHESTVSRAVRGKSVQTPQGQYEMKSFFTSKVQTNNGGSTSSTSVKILIRDMIKEENMKHPLSDQKIATALKTDNGIAVSRRTVAKYREQMRISSSSKRKKSYL
ncbi:MAG TPA: RNA polymerase factor sigma-54 [Bacillales bacterium]|nr:RNA polymerase factor sigma-54 [Bacillales bacterium]